MSKAVINRNFSIWLLVIMTLLAASALAIWTLPDNYNIKDVFGNFATELIRASILIINVQILVQSKKAHKYFLVIALSVIAATGIAISIYFDFKVNGTPWTQAEFWKVQVLSFLISAGELSLSFLLSPDGTRYSDLLKEMEGLRAWQEYGSEMMIFAQHICEATGTPYSEEWDTARQVQALEKSSKIVAESSERVEKLSAIIAHNSDLIAENKVSINNVRPIVCECGKIHDAKTNMRKEIECSCGKVATAEAQVMDIKKKVG